jgi:hypothetical protein
LVFFACAPIAVLVSIKDCNDKIGVVPANGAIKVLSGNAALVAGPGECLAMQAATAVCSAKSQVHG